jgi:hypothetical protein
MASRGRRGARCRGTSYTQHTSWLRHASPCFSLARKLLFSRRVVCGWCVCVRVCASVCASVCVWSVVRAHFPSVPPMGEGARVECRCTAHPCLLVVAVFPPSPSSCVSSSACAYARVSASTSAQLYVCHPAFNLSQRAEPATARHSCRIRVSLTV